MFGVQQGSHSPFSRCLDDALPPRRGYPDRMTGDDQRGHAKWLRIPLVDGHNDLPWELREQFSGDLSQVDLAEHSPSLQTDLPRLDTGGVAGQFWSVYVPPMPPGAAVITVLEQIDLVYRLVARYPQRMKIARGADDVGRCMEDGRLASLLGAEGGHVIGSSLGVLRMLRALGVSYLTLTHNTNVGWADSATDKRSAGGLTDFGREVVREMQRIGMLVDLSHTSADTMRDTLITATLPVIFSHSSAYTVCRHPRNVPDDVLGALAINGGICMVAFAAILVSQECADWQLGLVAEAGQRGMDQRDIAQVRSILPEWLAGRPEPHADIAQVADHIDHVREVAGLAHVGLGGDFDGTPDITTGLTDVSCYPALFAELRSRGWSYSDCTALACGNVLRVLSDAQTDIDVPSAADLTADLRDAPY
jgi:membrane dipeptidase